MRRVSPSETARAYQPGPRQLGPWQFGHWQLGPWQHSSVAQRDMVAVLEDGRATRRAAVLSKRARADELAPLEPPGRSILSVASP